jgi:hypothetical protein
MTKQPTRAAKKAASAKTVVEEVAGRRKSQPEAPNSLEASEFRRFQTL